MGEITFNEEFTNLDLANGQLVDLGWHISQAQDAKGCGGPYEEYVDRAINIALEVENGSREELTRKTGITILTGDLFDGSSSQVKKHHEEGEF